MEMNEEPGQQPDLLEQLVRLEWLLKRRHLRRHLAHGPMASPQRGQGRILSLLKIKPEISQKELSDILDIRPQSLGELLAKLEKAGYIERTPSETDRRVMNVRLTDAGRTAAEQPDDSGPGSFLDVLTEDERANLASYLAKITERLEAEEPGDFAEAMHGRHHGFGHHGPLDDGRGGPGFGGPGFGGRGRHSFFGHDFRNEWL